MNFLVGIGFSTILIVIIWYVLVVVASWHIFTKAGEPGWKSIIPIYNEYILYKISWKTQVLLRIFLNM